MKQSGDCERVRLVLYTRDTLLAMGAQSVLSSSAQFQVIAADPRLFALLPLVQQVDPHIILLDLPPGTTLGLIAVLRKAAPDARILMWGKSFSEELRHQASEMGIAGFLARELSPEQFILGLMGVETSTGDGGAHSIPANARMVKLTRRESQLVALLAQGLKNKEIASCIGITEGTVRIYLSKLFVKVGARDRLELALFGLKNAWCGQTSWDGENSFASGRDEARARPVLRSLILVEPDRRRGYAELPKAAGQ